MNKIGPLEHMRNLDTGDEMVHRIERLSEEYDIDPSDKNLKKLEQAIERLYQYTDKMARLYDVSEP